MESPENQSPAASVSLPSGAARLGGIGVLVVSLLAALALANGALAATQVPLGTADSFAVLAGAGITNTGPTTIVGDVGTFPTATMTGFGSVTLNGANHAGDAVTQGAKTDLVVAYGNAAGQGPASPIAGDLGGLTLTPGVYNSATSIGLTGSLTLNGGGNLDAVFIFQAGSTLTTASSSSVNLINGAQACNVFWQVGSSATLGTGSTFRGTLIALTDITVTTGATLTGRVLARNGAVTLDTNTITKPQTCTTAAQAAAAAAAAQAAIAAEAARVEAARAAAEAEAAAAKATEAAKAAEVAKAAAAAAVAAKAAETARVAAVKAAAAAKVAAAKAATVKAARTAAAKAATAAKVAAKKAATARLAAKKAAVAAKVATRRAATATARPAQRTSGFTG